jgi:predicted Zn-dependent protease
VLAASGILALALVLSWVIWQPLRAEQDTAAGLVAASRGDANTAVGHLQAAENRDPVAVEPLWDQSAIELAAGRVGPARDALTRALSRQPENAATWTRLGEFDLNQHHPPPALTELSKALSLDRGSTTIQADVAQARRAAG